MHRTLAFGLAAFIASLAGLLNAWSDGIIAPSSIDLNRTIDVLVIAVLGGLLRIEGAWVGAFAFVLINNYIQDYLGSYGDRIRTVVGLIFLLIVLVAPCRPDGPVGAVHTRDLEGKGRVVGALRRSGGGARRMSRHALPRNKFRAPRVSASGGGCRMQGQPPTRRARL